MEIGYRPSIATYFIIISIVGSNAQTIDSSFYNETMRNGQNLSLKILNYPKTFFSLTCHVQLPGKNPAMLAFFNKSSNMLVVNPRLDIQSQYFGRVKIENQLTVVISNISFAEEKHTYYFRIFYADSNGLPSEIYGTRHQLKSVQEPPKIFGEKLLAIYHGHEKSSMTLNCSFIGHPLEAAAWSGQLAAIGRQRTINVASGYLTEMTLELTIARLNAIHDMYSGICSTRNNYGYVQQSTKLNVTYAPKNTSLDISPANLKEGVRITMTCTSKANPSLLTYDIYRDSDLVSSTLTGIYSFTPVNCSASSGTYHCIPRNAFGNDSEAQRNVQIYGSPKVSLPFLSLTKNESDDFHIRCSAAGCPTPNITWYQNGMAIPLAEGPHLRLTNLKLSDAGVYRCQATNQKESDEKSFKLEVNYAPKNTTLTFDPTNPEEGNVVTLRCNTEAKPPATRFAFYRNGIEVYSSADGIYRFLSRDCKTETGAYSCTPRNLLGQDSKAKVSISVYGPPKIKIPTRRFEIRETLNVTLTCNAIGCPTPNITWFRNGTNVAIGRGSVLKLYRLRPETAGTYKCTASNQRENTSDFVELAVRYPPKNTILTVVNKEPREDTNITLRCVANAYPAIHTYTFYRNGVLQNSSKNEYTFLSKSCASESGQYQCTPENELGKESVGKTSLSIYGPPKPKIPPLMVKVAIDENKGVNLSCTATGCPNPNISWYKDGNSKILARGQRLVLTNLSPMDAGTYRCLASNSKENKSAVSEVKVNFSPRKLVMTTNMVKGYLPEGNDLIVMCTANAFPKAKYKFFQDGKSLGISDSGILRINKTNCKTHSGNYSCYGFNFRGNSSTVTKTVVIEGPPTVTTTPKSKIANESNDVAFFCDAIGCPTPNLTWYKGGQVVAIGKKLTFKRLQRKKDGAYSCVAKNSRGNKTSSFNLVVQFRAEGTQLMGPAVVVAGSRVQLTCTASGNPKPKYSFHKRSAVTSLTAVQSTNSESTGVLVIDKIQFDKSYNTIYGCNPMNILGKAGMRELNVNIEVAPTTQTITPSISLIQKKETEALNLDCKVEYANPMADVEWKKDGNNKVLSKKGGLRFSSLKRTDSGTYTCKVSNKLGTLSKQVTLNVTYAPEVSPSIEKEFNVCVDKTITIDCYGAGNPVPQAVIRQGTNVIASSYEKASVAITITNERYGNYECELTNTNGVVKQSIKVNKQVLPGIPTDTTINIVANSLEIKWKLPKCSGQSGVASFVIYYRGKNDKEEKKETVQCKTPVCEHTLKNLDEKTIYEVSVVAIDGKGKEGKKQFVQGIETKAAVAPQKSKKLSGTTVTFIVIGTAVVFLLAIALFVMMRRKSVTNDVEVNKSSNDNDKPTRAAPKEDVAPKFDNLAYATENEADVKENGTGGPTSNGTGDKAHDNPACNVDDDEEAGNVPSEEVIDDPKTEEAPAEETAEPSTPAEENGSYELNEMQPEEKAEVKETPKISRKTEREYL